MKKKTWDLYAPIYKHAMKADQKIYDYMRTVEAADKIVILSDGTVAEEGSPAELLAKENGLFRRMTQLQAASSGWSI